MQNESMHDAAQDSFSEVCRMWLSSVRLRVKKSTYARYRFLVEKYALRYLGGYTLSDITYPIVENTVCVLLESGRLDGRGGLSPKTAGDIFSVLRCILRYARMRFGAPDFPLDGITIRREHRELPVLDRQEQYLMTKRLLGSESLSDAGVLLSLYTGIRLGEVCALRWGEIDLTSAELRVVATMQRIPMPPGNTPRTRVVLTEPKSAASIRRIPMPEPICRKLFSLRAPEDAFFLTGRADCFIEPRTMQNHFRRCTDACGIRAVNYHALRHTFATRCIESGFDIKCLSEILGHTNVSITLNRYVHASFDLKRQSMSRLAENFLMTLS